MNAKYFLIKGQYLCVLCGRARGVGVTKMDAYSAARKEL